MAPGRVIYYDFNHCRDFIEERVKALRDTVTGLDALALYRELYYSFAYEALEHEALTIGQFDTGIVYAFIPELLAPADYPQGHKVMREKALELLGNAESPVVLDLVQSQLQEPEVGPRGKIKSWMRPEFLEDIILTGKVRIHLYFDASSFYGQVIRPQLEERGFELIEDYRQCAKRGEVRLRHPNAPGKLYRVPWILWVREMMGGGYNVVYLMASFAAYMQKLETAVGLKSEPAAKDSH